MARTQRVAVGQAQATGPITTARTDPCNCHAPAPRRCASVAAGSQQIVNLVFELLDPMLGLLPCGCTIVAIILVGVERQQGNEKDCYDDDKRGAHVFRLQGVRRRGPSPGDRC
jgi:hypothetical protein